MRALPVLWILLAIALLAGGVTWVVDRGDLQRDPATDEVPASAERRADGAARLEGQGKQVLRSDVRVRVLARDGVPLEGVRVLAPRPMGEGDPLQVVLETDARGEVLLADVPLDGSVAVSVARHEPHAVRERLVVLETRLGLRCDVEGVDVETGRAVTDLAWAAKPRGEARPGGRLIPLEPGVHGRMSWVFEPPEGMVVWPPFRWTDALSRYATGVRVVVPLYAEVDLEVEVLDADGRPTKDAEPPTCHLGGAKLDAVAYEEVQPHRFRVRGVPFVAGAELRLEARTSIVEEEEVVEERIGRTFLRVPMARRMRVTLRAPPGIIYNESVLDFDFHDNSMIGLGGRPGKETPPPPGTVEIEVRRVDGRPAAGAAYQVIPCLDRPAVSADMSGHLDQHGKARIQVPAGRCRIRIETPGLVPMRQELEVVAGGASVVSLDEPRGADLDVQVVDKEGNPVPFAQLEVVAWPWVDLDPDGVQRLDPFVDHEGRRVLRRLPTDRDVELRVKFLGKKRTTSLRLEDGQRRVLELKLPLERKPR